MLKNKKDGLRLSPFFFLSLSLAALALLMHILCAKLPALADFITATLSPVFRVSLGFASALFPFSIVEGLIITSPAVIALLVFFARRAAREPKKTAHMLSALLSVPLLLYSLFVFSFGAGYYTTPLGDRLALEEKAPNAENLTALTALLAARAETCAEEAAISVGPSGSHMPFSYAEMNTRLIRAYDAVEEKHGILKNFSVGTKPIALSHPMAHTHITGVYTFMTGEMNVCTAFPDFSTVFTAAHEMAHARGIAREDEANFVAFLALELSDDPYLRYAGYMNLLQYVSNALYETDPQAYRAVWQTYSDTVVSELRAYNAAFKQYSGSFASDIAGSINNAYLEGMGTEGSVSYDLVVHLAVRYLN